MKLVTFRMSGGGGSTVLVNPEHVVCVLEAGDRRAQIITTGLTGQSAMTLLVDEAAVAAAARLQAATDPRDLCA